jgi:SAM-dependent methyltransferase
LTSEPADSYALGRSQAETRRLIVQHQLYGPLTRQFLTAAGVTAGMKVLDVGSGAGDVALLLAELVGPQGQVVGVDTNAAILDTGRSRVEAAGWTTVRFLAGDALALELDSDFDAVVGRWVLQYTSDPRRCCAGPATGSAPAGSSPSRRSTSAPRPAPTRPGRCTIRSFAGRPRRPAPPGPIPRWG